MRTKAYKTYACKALLALLGAVVVQGCTREEYADIQPGDGEVVVRLEVNVEGGANTATRGMTGDQETTIETIDVYHFVRKPGTTGDDYANYQGMSISPAQGTFADGPPSWVSAKLNTFPGQDSRLVVVVNARDDYGYQRTMTLKDFTDALIVEETGEWYTGTSRPLPMYAITGNVEVKKDAPDITDNGEPFPLLRMHAKFTVRLKDPLDEGVFELVSLCVFNRKTQGFLPYAGPLDYTDGSDKPKVTAPNIPSTTDTEYLPGLAEPYYTVGTDNQKPDYGMIVNKQYVFEVNNADESDRLKKTALVIGGKYGTDTEVTYYRVDIPDDVTGGNILRNRNYDVEIQWVKNSGYDTAEEAFIGSKQIEYTVTVVPWGMENHVPLPWSVRESSNCYIVKPGERPFNIPVYGQIAQAIANGGLDASWLTSDMMLGAELIWSEVSETAVVKQLKAYNYSDVTKALLTVWPGDTEGNAMVGVYNDINKNGVRDTGEDFLWSWHIWMTAYEPGNGVGTLGFMDRYLGALNNAWNINFGGGPAADFRSYFITNLSLNDVVGLTYQWGRKDPFSPKHIFGAETYNDENRTASLITGNTVVQSVRTPYKVVSDWASPGGTALWNSSKTAYDPCPTGWKIPAVGIFGIKSWSTLVNGGIWYDDGFYPFAGSRWASSGGLYSASSLSWDIGGQCWMDYPGVALSTSVAVGLSTSANPYGANTPYMFQVRCINDGILPIPPALSTDSDGKDIITDGRAYTINVTSNTEWTASIHRGTDQVTITNDNAIMGKPLLDTATGLNGGSAEASVSGNGNGSITLTTVDYTSPKKIIEGDLVVVFRNKATGEILDQTRITVWDGAKWARSNVVWDDAGGRLTFAATRNDNDRIPANSQGVFFQWGSLVAVGPVGAFADAILYDPTNTYTYGIWESIPCIDSTTAPFNDDSATADDFAGYGLAGSGYDAGGRGDICRYISDQPGWVLGNWRLPTAQEGLDLINEQTSIPYGVWSDIGATPAGRNSYGDHAFGFYQPAVGRMLGRGIAAGGDDPQNPSVGVFIPVGGNRHYNTGAGVSTGYGIYNMTASSNLSMNHIIHSTSGYLSYTGYYRRGGQSVRCVRDLGKR